MTMDVFDIDKSGDDILNNNYSTVLIKNGKKFLGYRIPPRIKERLKQCFDKGELNLNKKNKLNFKIRFHTAVIILLSKEAIKGRNKRDICNFNICNDIDGHFHEIKKMVYDNLKSLIPKLTMDDIRQIKFTKDAPINIVAKALLRKKEKILKKYKFKKYKFKLEDIINLVKKSKR